MLKHKTNFTGKFSVGRGGPHTFSTNYKRKWNITCREKLFKLYIYVEIT